jgi:hypothetical protein
MHPGQGRCVLSITQLEKHNKQNWNKSDAMTTISTHQMHIACATQLLVPEVKHNVSQKIDDNKMRSKYNHDRTVRQAPTLEKDGEVFVKPVSIWVPGQIKDQDHTT